MTHPLAAAVRLTWRSGRGLAAAMVTLTLLTVAGHQAVHRTDRTRRPEWPRHSIRLLTLLTMQSR